MFLLRFPALCCLIPHNFLVSASPHEHSAHSANLLHPMHDTEPVRRWAEEAVCSSFLSCAVLSCLASPSCLLYLINTAHASPTFPTHGMMLRPTGVGWMKLFVHLFFFLASYSLICHNFLVFALPYKHSTRLTNLLYPLNNT